MSADLIVKDGQVVSLDYTLHKDGKVVDTSEGREPIQFIQGEGHIITGLENQLYGLRVGDHKDVVIVAEDGYGEVDVDAFMEVPRNQYPANIPLEVGIELQLQGQDGQPMIARIENVGEENIQMDFNHPLAGKEIHFTVKVVGLHEATQEEKDHRHVHDREH